MPVIMEKSQEAVSIIGTSLQKLAECYPEVFPEVRENLLKIPNGPHQRTNPAPCPQMYQKNIDTPKSHAQALRMQADTIQKIFPDLFPVD